jgi:catechol 2,3-dioxygenase-like lactoylglutathione lyase family enzyme
MNIQFERLNHVQICIPKGEEKTAKDFYMGILGLEEIEKPEPLKANGGFWLKVADIELHIGTEKMDEKNVGKRHPAFEVSDLDRVRQYLEDNHVHLKEDTPIPNIKRFSLFDPFNNRIEFMEKLKK